MTALASRNARTGLKALLFACAMLALAFASVPLYRAFCQATGFGGTTMRAKGDAPGAVAGEIGVRFDANVTPGMPWRFEPEQTHIRIAPGKRTIAYYRAKNLSAVTTTGQAIFNVTPEQTGRYFSKIQCFCFTEQTLKPGQEVRMPVVFFVDPKLRDDAATRDIDEITLSYTFYPVEKPGSAS